MSLMGTSSLVAGAVWGGYETFRRCGLAGGIVSMGRALSDYSLTRFLLSLLPVCR